jgi:Lon protease-like protein
MPTHSGSQLLLELPLFPLNSVLFPGTPLSLHIFEERYKLMLRRCIDANEPFGVVLIKSGSEVGRVAVPHLVGCSALVTDVEALDGGRMNITAVGVERFRTVSFEHNQPYLVGKVETFPLPIERPDVIRRSGRQLRPWIARYLGMIEQSEKVQVNLKELPHDSLGLAYYAAALLRTPLAQKQDLLMASSADQFVEAVRALYRKEVVLYDAILRHHHGQEARFSLN